MDSSGGPLMLSCHSLSLSPIHLKELQRSRNLVKSSQPASWMAAEQRRGHTFSRVFVNNCAMYTLSEAICIIQSWVICSCCSLVKYSPNILLNLRQYFCSSANDIKSGISFVSSYFLCIYIVCTCQCGSKFPSLYSMFSLKYSWILCLQQFGFSFIFIPASHYFTSDYTVYRYIINKKDFNS